MKFIKFINFIIFVYVFACRTTFRLAGVLPLKAALLSL